uniref:Uncharacterized protein n=1 Tax=Neogobius melanostomus TaxID=47308 RepID=A0A8C6WUA6_9GOBI
MFETFLHWKEQSQGFKTSPPTTPSASGELQVKHKWGVSVMSMCRLQEASEGQDLSYQLRASLFDGRQQQFLGQTWRSPPQSVPSCSFGSSASLSCLPKVLYFHTVLRIPGVLLVVELVELTVRADSSHQARGRGFTLLELFSPKTSPAASEGNHKLNLHHGSPRSLLHPALKDTTDCKDTCSPVAL